MASLLEAKKKVHILAHACVLRQSFGAAKQLTNQYSRHRKMTKHLNALDACLMRAAHIMS